MLSDLRRLLRTRVTRRQAPPRAAQRRPAPQPLQRQRLVGRQRGARRWSPARGRRDSLCTDIGADVGRSQARGCGPGRA